MDCATGTGFSLEGNAGQRCVGKATVRFLNNPNKKVFTTTKRFLATTRCWPEFIPNLPASAMTLEKSDYANSRKFGGA